MDIVINIDSLQLYAEFFVKMNALLRSHCELTVALLAKCILNLSRFEKTLKQHLFLTHGKIDFLQTVV